MTTAAATPAIPTMPIIKADRILILDFGSHYSQLIARRVRDSGVFCEMFPFDIDTQRITDFGAKGIILSGGPESVHAENSPRINDAVFDLGVPVLGICYGMQAMAECFGGKVHASDIHEFGAATINIDGKSTLTDGIEDAAAKLNVWMSHGDKVVDAPQGFDIVASTPSCPIAIMADDSRHYYGLQFHPEVTHTAQGSALQGVSSMKSVAVLVAGRLITSSICVSNSLKSKSVTSKYYSVYQVVLIAQSLRHYCIKPSAIN